MESSRVILSEVGIKAKSFSELYRMLTVEGGLYLPPAEYTNMSFISDICFGDKKALHADKVRVCTTPQVKGLRAENLIQFLVEECNGEEYLPSNYMERKPFRSWIANLCNTLKHDKFNKFVKDVLAVREEALLEKKNLAININPQIANIFKSSKMVAVAPGRSHQLLRKNVIRKNREMREARDKEKEEELASIPGFVVEIDNLRQELEVKEQEIELLMADRDILKDLYEKGVIDDKGNLL